jgi:CheY-like chemotaxis protein
MIYPASSPPMTVLMAEDSEHDVRAVQRIWAKSGIRNNLMVVRNGEECLDYLLRRGAYVEPSSSPRPGVLLLDINMPKVDGFEVLNRIRESPELRRLPVVMLTTSSREEDRVRSYDLGANAYMTKPVGMEKLTQSLIAFNVFWELVALPESPEHDGSAAPDRYGSGQGSPGR